MKTLVYKRNTLYYFLFFMASIFSCNTIDCKKSTSSSLTPINGIKFIENDWNYALLKAKSQHKLIFLDIYASWCSPCKLLKQVTFIDKNVGLYFNNNFINISVDGEKGVGPQLANQYQIEGYPALIIADENGKVIAKSVGYLTAEELIKFGKIVFEKNVQALKMYPQ